MVRSPIDRGIGLFQPRHSKDNVFTTTVGDVKLDFVVYSGYGDEHGTEKFDISSFVWSLINVSNGDCFGESVGSDVVSPHKIVVDTIELCARINQSLS